MNSNKKIKLSEVRNQVVKWAQKRADGTSLAVRAHQYNTSNDLKVSEPSSLRTDNFGNCMCEIKIPRR